MFIVPELEKEARILSSSWETQKKLKLLRGERDNIEDQVHHLKWYLEHEDLDTSEKEKLTAKLELLEVTEHVFVQIIKTPREVSTSRWRGLLACTQVKLEIRGYTLLTNAIGQQRTSWLMSQIFSLCKIQVCCLFVVCSSNRCRLNFVAMCICL